MSEVDICRESVVGSGDIKGTILEMGMCLDDGKDSREAGVARIKGQRGAWGRGGEGQWVRSYRQCKCFELC